MPRLHFPKAKHYQLKVFDYGSDEYHQAVQLRYELFSLEHNITFGEVFASSMTGMSHIKMQKEMMYVVAPAAQQGLAAE